MCSQFFYRVVFTMALVVSVSYSMAHTNSTDPTDDNVTFANNSNSFLRLGLAPGFTSHASFSSTTSTAIVPNSILILSKDINATTKSLSSQERMQGLRAGEQAMRDRRFADIIAARSPLPSPSPESRHRYAVNTCPNVSNLALAAVGEIAATRKIESIR